MKTRHVVVWIGLVAWGLAAGTSVLFVAGCNGEQDDDDTTTALEPAPSFTPEADGGPSSNRVRLEMISASAEENTITLGVRADDVERLYGGGFVLTYDPERIEVRNVMAGALAADGVLASSLGTVQEVPGELTVGFVVEGGLESGVLTAVTLALKGGGSSAVGFKGPEYREESRTRMLVAADGVALAGVRWLGGTVEPAEEG